MRPLEGLLVIDFSSLLPGPLASLLLAEAGAEVIKVERPEVGDDMRAYAPSWGADGATFALLNRGKQSVTLDLKDSTARTVLEPLIERADILIEQFRPGVMARLGLAYEAVAAINPRLIYCSISAYGQTGPRCGVAGHDINLLAETGVLALSNPTGSHAALPPTPIGDIAGGSYPAVINILLALREREKTGVGRHLDIAIGDNVFTLAYWALAQGWGAERFPRNRDHLVTGASPRYRLYPTRDGGIVAAAPLEPKFWTNFCELLKLDLALRDDARDPAATAAGVAAIIAAEDASTWSRCFASSECCCSVVVDLEHALADPHFQARGLFDHRLVNEHGKTMPALPVPIDSGFRAPTGTVLAAPPLGNANANLPKGDDVSPREAVGKGQR
jgi:alpha-methylacyl-CoA racemase